MRKSEELRKFQWAMKRRPTKHELIFMDKLLDEGVEFKSQMILGFYILDFVIPDRMIIFEIDGETHNKRYDERRDEFCKECGFVVIRIKNKDTQDYDLSILDIMPEVPLYVFRSGLSKANSLRSAAIKPPKPQKKPRKKKKRKEPKYHFKEKVIMNPAKVKHYAEIQQKEKEFNIKMRALRQNP